MEAQAAPVFLTCQGRVEATAFGEEFGWTQDFTVIVDIENSTLTLPERVYQDLSVSDTRVDSETTDGHTKKRTALDRSTGELNEEVTSYGIPVFTLEALCEPVQKQF
jgi:hypothetical protein